MSLKLIKRLFRHLLVLPGAARRHFPEDSMQRIEQAIIQSELTHSGEICFVVESHLNIEDIFYRVSGRRRAADVFSQFKVWDTEHNNGVLIYLLLADRDFEILADRGVHQRVGDVGWERICQQMETLFRRGQFEAGVIFGIEKIGEQLAQHYPANGTKLNELANAPVIL